MARVRFLICLCVFNEASHAEADGGGYTGFCWFSCTELELKIMREIHCSSVMGSLNFPFVVF